MHRWTGQVHAPLGRVRECTMRIFMSYRRKDSADVSGRIYDRLAAHFGEETVFKDVDDIPFGVDFKKHLNNVVARTAVELVVIGPDWLNATDEAGLRRLDDPTDFVRIEIEAALNRDIPVVPLLVQGAAMPKGEELPSGLTKLAYRNGTPVRPDPDFHRDMDRLIKGLEEYVGPQAKPARSAAQPRPASPALPPQPPPSPSKEDILYEGAGDRVTSRVAHVGGATYPISEIRSVSMKQLDPPFSEMVKVGAPAWVVGFVFVLTMFLAQDLAGVVFVALCIAVVYAMIRLAPNWPKYTVRIKNSDGERDILVSKKRAVVRRIVRAINKARRMR